MAVKPLLVAFVLAAGLHQPARADEACPGFSPEAPVVRLAGTDMAGDPLLADGRTLRLVGIGPRQDAGQRARFAAALQPWTGRELALIVLGAADRWGRLPARLLALDGEARSEPADLARALLDSGAALHLADAAHPACGAALRPAATTGSTGGAGLLGAANTAVDGHDLAALKAHEGRFILLEGRIASVGDRPQRIYLNFSRRRGEAASIVLSRKLWRDLQDAGWTASGLSGKRLRARGILSGRDGLLLDVTSRLALELVD